MTQWVRYELKGEVGFGTLEGEMIAVHSGDMFANPKPTGAKVPLAAVKLLTPCVPGKMIALWNNFHALAAKLKAAIPDEPLYLIKAASSYLAAGEPIRRPPGYTGKIVYEGELGIVIGKRLANASEAEAAKAIFGYTCINDVTAADTLNKNPAFAQWTRSKSHDTFGVFGPAIATGLDPSKLTVRTVLNGAEKQNYPVADMILPPVKIVSLLSKDMTLMPGDVIACGTSVGVSAMKEASNVIEVSIEGIGTLRNPFDQEIPSEFLGGSPPPPMRICVVGAGAIGGLMAAKLALAGNPVTVVDVGRHLAAIRDKGLKLIWENGKEFVAKVKAVVTLAEAGPQDFVVLSVKAHFLEQAAREIESVLGPETMVLTVQNGLPWWYFQRLGGPHEGHKLESLDPAGVLARKIAPERIIGCVVYPAAAVVEPGVIRHVEGDRFPIGELDGRETERVKRLHDVLVAAGLKSRVLSDIRSEIWLKAWGNLSFNPISALSHATLTDICKFPETRQLAADMMKEAQAVAEKLGIVFRHSIEKRIEGAEAVGAHKTSMLQDVEAGRSLETEALIGSILEMAKLTGTPSPSIQAVYALVKLLNRTMLTEHGALRMEKVA